MESLGAHSLTIRGGDQLRRSEQGFTTTGLAHAIPGCPEETKSLKNEIKGKISSEDAIRD
jgi:hypothetical protein